MCVWYQLAHWQHRLAITWVGTKILKPELIWGIQYASSWPAVASVAASLLRYTLKFRRGDHELAVVS